LWLATLWRYSLGDVTQQYFAASNEVDFVQFLLNINTHDLRVFAYLFCTFHDVSCNRFQVMQTNKQKDKQEALPALARARL